MGESRRAVLSRCMAAAMMPLAAHVAYSPDAHAEEAPLTPAAADASAQAAPRDGAITVDGRTIHYLDWGPGDRPALILIHAFDRSARSYDQVAPLLNQRQRVIAMDLRGHGDSDWSPTGEYAVEDYVADLHALILQLNLPSVSLMGCSIGGRVVQVYAGLHPDRVSKLIVLDVGFARPESTTRILSERIAREQQGWASEDELFASLRRAQTRVPEDVHRRQIRDETKRLANGRIAWKYDPKIVNGMGPVELWDYVRRIKAPALYVVGGRSRLVTAEEQQLLRTLPFAEVVTIPEAGHYPQEDTPEVFLAIVKAFLAG
jgi:pimeloyl-ACP methyl ester carboxylesterase